MTESMVYVGKELEAMSFAENSYRWILEIFKPYLGSRIVEVGAGIGAFSELILERPPSSLTLVEPSPNMYSVLVNRIEAIEASVTEIQTYNSTFASIADEIKETQRPDSIIYVNVLEHIEDDATELAIVQRTLSDGGRAFVFVPALPRLYGSFDEQIGHFRRYTKGELERKCQAAGFRVIDSGYFDFVGILPWWVKYCLMRSDTMEAGAVKFYDKCCVPAIKAFESMIRPPIGKNVFLIAEKNG